MLESDAFGHLVSFCIRMAGFSQPTKWELLAPWELTALVR
jgi:hypothetical protein